MDEPTDWLDELLQDAGAAWREAQGPAPEYDAAAGLKRIAEKVAARQANPIDHPLTELDRLVEALLDRVPTEGPSDPDAPPVPGQDPVGDGLRRIQADVASYHAGTYGPAWWAEYEKTDRGD